jgi:hypothetical protein
MFQLEDYCKGFNEVLFVIVIRPISYMLISNSP